MEPALKGEDNVRIIRAVRNIIRVVLIVLLVLSAVHGYESLRLDFIRGTLCHLTIGTFSVSCPFGFIQLWLSASSPAYSLLISSLFFIVISLIFGRVFCSWICPIGLVTEALHYLKVRLLRRRRSERGSTSSISSSFPVGTRSIDRSVKYIFLASVIVVSVLLRYPVFCLICPLGILSRNLFFLSSFHFVMPEIIILGVILLFELFLLDRGWCGSLCPLGALYVLLGQPKIVSLRVKWKEICEKCKRCWEHCPMGIIPSEQVGIDECSNCGLCEEICAHEVALPRFLHPKRWKDALKRVFKV